MTLQPLFPGKTEGSQFIEQVSVLGLPRQSELKKMSGAISQTMLELVQRLDDLPNMDFKKILPYNDYSKLDIAEAADLISKMLKWTPNDRISCQEALEHGFFKGVKTP